MMDLHKNGKLLYDLRKAKGMTQKDVAEKLGVLPKTVSKWETGHGFPDVSLVTDLAEILGTSAETVLSGSLSQNEEEIGNMKKIKFYVCPECGNILVQPGNGEIVCCGKKLEASDAEESDNEHDLKVEIIENDFYITFNHPMTKEHYLQFISYVSCDRVLIVRLYPEQGGEIRIPQMYGGKLYYYCSRHGLFTHTITV